MKDLIASFPKNIQDTLEIVSKVNIQNKNNDIRNIVICGMGGSGIGGKIVSQLVAGEIKVPITLVQDYNLPNFVNQHTLVIGSSYSGYTEETLYTVKEAHAKGALVINICSGGELEAFSVENGLDYIKNVGGNPPRSALVFSIIEQIYILTSLNLISDRIFNEIKNCQSFLVENENHIHEEAEKLANYLHSKIPVLYATSEYEGALVRARQQINENAKMLCWHHVIPEMNHNELVGWAGGDDKFGVVILNTKDYNQRNITRVNFTLDKIKNYTSNIYTLDIDGTNYTERTFYCIYLIDWASWYLSELNQVDILDIKVIDQLKSTLANE